MKKTFQTFTALCALGAALLALPAAAQETFSTTNNLGNGTQYTLYPTNGPGLGTGSGVSMNNGYKTLGFSLSGDVQNNASAVIGLTLVRADSLNTFGITNWETTPVYHFLITVPAMTNHFTWTTNLPDDFTGGGLKAGIEQLTNTFASGQTISNLVCKPIKKFNTVAYP